MNEEDKRASAGETEGDKPEALQAESGETRTEGETIEEVIAEPVEETPPPAPKRGGGLGAWSLGLLALAVAAGGSGAGYWAWQQLKAADAAQDATLAELNKGLVNLGANPDIQALRGELGSETLALQTADQQLAAQLAAQGRELEGLKDALTAVHEISLRDQRGWIVAEVEYLILIANHRLRLMRDFPGAIEALEAADRRVRDLGDPKLLPVREKLADEIQLLKDFEKPDLVGIALKLDRMTTHLAPMPLQMPVPDAETRRDLSVAVGEEDGKSLSGLATHVWNEFQKHITYREYPEAVQSLPDTETELHLNQLLRLRLEGARIAVLRQDDAEYHRQLGASLEWVREKFSGPKAEQLAAEIEALNAVNLRPELPELTASLDKLRELNRPRPQAPAARPAPAPAAPTAPAAPEAAPAGDSAS